MMRRFSLKAAVLAAALLLGALIPALAQQRGPGLVGDVNGDGRITSADALAVYAYLAGRPIPATFDVPGRGDADGDGQITRADAELIMRVAVGQAAGDRPVGKPVVPGTAPAEGPLRLQCVANTRSATVRCSEPGAPTPAGMQGDRIYYGGQNVNVTLITDNVTTVADTFAFDMKVKNLLGQAIGTHDGINMDSVKVFFDAEPRNTSSTPNNGTVTAVNHDGAQAFLSSEPQKYFSYGQIIQPQGTSAVRRWKLLRDPAVESFTFSLWVSSPVQHPNGYVDVYPDSAEISAGATLQLSDTVRNRLGRPVGGTVSWSSANTAIATVDANGLVTGVSDGTVVITGSTPNRSAGKMKLVVLTASADSSTLSASRTTLPVRDTSVVTLQLRSANGTPLTRSAGTVILSASAGTLAVTDNGNGTYTGRLTSPTVGLVKVSGTLDGNAFADTARVTFTAGSAAGYVVTSSASTVAAGSPVTITAQTVDADSNAVAAEGTVINWTSTNGGSFATTTSVTDSAGTATVVFTTGTTAGVTHTVTATDSLSRTGTSGSITTQVGLAAKLAIVQEPTNTVAGASISPAVTVAVQDANGNVVTTATDQVNASIGHNAAGGTLAGTKSVAPVNGIATFSNLSIDKAGTGYTLAFSGVALEPDTSSTFNVTPGAAAKLVLVTQPSDTVQNAVDLPRQPVAQLQDANGNPVAQAGVQVTAAIAAGGGALGGTATVNTDANGTATFAGLSITGGVGDRTLSFASTGLTSATSDIVHVKAGAASQLTIQTEPSSTAQSGASFSRQPVIVLRDVSGNVVSQAGVEVTAAIASGGGTLGGTLAVSTSADGTATFTDLSITGTVGDRTLSFSATGLASATSAAVSVTAGAATQLGITTQPSSSAQNGGAFAQQPVIQLRDASGNAVAQAGVEVTAAIASGGGTLGGTATVNTDANGTATFAGLSITGTVGDRTLSFSTTGLTPATSTTISVTAGAATQLVITTQPSSTAQAGAAFAQQPVVQLQDASGNAVAQAGVEVTAAIASGGGTLGGTAAVNTDANGTATFAGLSISGTVGDRTLSFSASGLTPATSGTISVTAGAASQLVVTTQPSSTAQAGAAFAQQPVVQLQDASGNAVAQAGVEVTAAIATGGGTLGGTVAVNTDANGTATFTNLSIAGLVGDRTLSFSATGLTGAPSTTISVTAGAASQLVITTQPSTTAQAGAAFAQQPVVQLQDASGNAVAQAGVEVTAAIASGGGTLGGTAAVNTDANGTATFAGLSIGGTVGDRTLSFSATGLAPATSGTISVTAGAAAALAFSVQPSNVVASASISPAVQVSIVDAFGNVTASTDNVTLTIGTNPSGGTLSGTATQAAVGGVATFSDLSINLVGTGYTLSAASGSLTGTSNAFNVTHGPLDHFLVEKAGGGAIGVQLAGTPFSVRVTAQDAYNNTVTDFSGTVGFTSTPSGGISAGGTSGAFTAGVLTSHSITFGTPGAFTLTATNTAAAKSGTSNSFDVQAPPVAVNEGPAPNSAPGQPFHAYYSTSGSPQTYTLAAPGLLANDNLGFPAAEITSFGADSLGGSVTNHAAGSTVNPLPGDNRTTGSLSVTREGAVTFTPPDGFTGNYVFRYRLTNVRGFMDGSVTIAVGARPSAASDAYPNSLVGNVRINTATSSGFNVTTNDTGDGRVLAVTGASNGEAILSQNGTFEFRPAAGFRNGTASFTYTVTNGFGTAPAATVTVPVSNSAVWFVNAGEATNGDGRFHSPKNCLAGTACFSDVANDAANDGIFLYAGGYIGGLSLLSGQKLIGQRATASLSSLAGVTWLADSGPEPTMSSASALEVTAPGGTAVTLNSGNLLRGFNFGNVTAAGTALAGTSFGTLTISEVGINTNGRALNLTTGTLSGSLTGVNSTGGANNIALSGVGTTGTFSFGSGVLSGAAGEALSLTGASTGTYTYGGPITGGAGAAVNISGGTATLTLPGNVTQANNAALVNVTGGHTGTLTLTGQISATNGTGLQFSNADGTYNLDGVQAASSLNGGDAGIDILAASSGTFTFGTNLPISNPSGTAVYVNASSPTLTVKGAVTQGAGKRGIYLENNTGGSSTFSGLLTLNTSTQNAFEATHTSQAGTVVASNATNVISTSSGTALRVNNVSIGTGGLVFRSISATGGGVASNGIVLNNTGTTAGLTVSGNGSAGTGGTIQNAAGADGAVAGNGIYLNNTQGVSLSWMQLNGHANNAIFGSAVNGFTLANSVINGTNGSNDATPHNESSIRFDNLTGSAAITNTSISGGFSNNVRVYNNTPGTLNRLTFTNVNVGANSTNNGNDGIGIEASGGAVMNVTVQNSTFTSSRGDLFQMSVPSGSGDLVFSTNTLSNNHPGIATGGGGVSIASGGTGTLTTNISGNTFRDAVGHAVLIVKDVGTGTLSGTFHNNQIGVVAVANSGSLEGAGLKVQQAGQGTMTMAVTNNQIRQYNNEGILFQAGAGIAYGGNFNVSASGNTLSNPGSNASIGNIFQGLVLNNGVTGPASPADSFVTCFNVGANTLTGSGRNGGFDVRVRQRMSTTVLLPGYAGGQYDTGAVSSYLLGRLGGSPTASAFSEGSPTPGFQSTAGNCT